MESNAEQTQLGILDYRLSSVAGRLGRIVSDLKEIIEVSEAEGLRKKQHDVHPVTSPRKGIKAKDRVNKAEIIKGFRDSVDKKIKKS